MAGAPPLPRRPSPPAPWASHVPRKPTERGLGSYAMFPDTEEPTQPGSPRDDRAAVLVRLYTNLTPEERRRLVLLADYWFRCEANGRALVEGVACELALKV